MTKKIVLGVAVVALAALVMAPSASAACSSIRSASTYTTAATAYWTTANPGVAAGQTWQLGAPATWNGSGSGTPCPESIVYFSGANANLNLDLASCGAGCPASLSTLAVLALNKTTAGSEFLLATVTETPASTVNFDYSVQGNHAFVAIPRPRVLASSRAGATINLNVAIDSIAAGLYGPNAATGVTGYRILAGQTPTAATNDLGRDAASYPTVVATIPAAGGGAATSAVAVNCTDITKDQWLVTQISFENGSVLSGAVGGATRVRCNQALANPDPKFKIIKKGLGTGTVKN